MTTCREHPNCVVIFRPYRRDPRSGRLIYPRNGRVFPIHVKG